MMKIELTRELAEYIVEAENVCSGESQGPELKGEWLELLRLIRDEYKITPYEDIS